MYRQPLKEIKCKKCGRHVIPLRILKESKYKKKFYVIQCPKCDYESDIEDYD